MSTLVVNSFKGKMRGLLPNQIFVFASTIGGSHDTGHALWAACHAGAKRGIASGLCGQSYGIITKDKKSSRKPPVDMETVINSIKVLYTHARNMPDKEFIIPYGIRPLPVGYTPEQIAMMLLDAGPIPPNLLFKEEFANLLITINQKIKGYHEASSMRTYRE
jgi:hypothetical protein